MAYYDRNDLDANTDKALLQFAEHWQDPTRGQPPALRSFEQQFESCMVEAKSAWNGAMKQINDLQIENKRLRSKLESIKSLAEKAVQP